MIKIMIVDDELSAGNILQRLIEKHIAGNKTIKICRSAQEALDAIPLFRPTLIMLDVEMPNMNGFDLLNKASNGDFDVIFTTAYDRYAIKAIRFSALDYLLKPIDISELQNAINRHIIKQERHPLKKENLVNNLIHNLNQKNQSHFKLALSTAEGVFFIDPADILRCEGDNNYTHFYFLNKHPIIVSKTLKEYEEILNEHGFVRIHKSHLVNIRHVAHLDKEGMLWIKDGMSLPVSRRRKEEVLRLLSEK
ncbi:LytR/AlgR family response regulator transcription factor [Chryseolinea soli]|nr:LytTR family DNA-binding domain-containing protein [Chryseolinea soli]